MVCGVAVLVKTASSHYGTGANSYQIHSNDEFDYPICSLSQVNGLRAEK